MNSDIYYELKATKRNTEYIAFSITSSGLHQKKPKLFGGFSEKFMAAQNIGTYKVGKPSFGESFVHIDGIGKGRGGSWGHMNISIPEKDIDTFRQAMDKLLNAQ